MNHSTVEKITDLARYHSGSVVSTTIMKKKTGTVTLFAFEEHQGLSEHSAPYDALVQVLEGKTIITISGKDFSLQSGNIIILPANEPHAVRAVTKFKMMLTMIRD
ncbi:MAG: cupin domain-containing protein [Fidelibacterota bacterium]